MLWVELTFLTGGETEKMKKLSDYKGFQSYHSFFDQIFTYPRHFYSRDRENRVESELLLVGKRSFFL